MKTATLTILRRLLAMALGALGLGAFAAGPASAQQIPAPDLFDGQVACSMNVPTPPTTLLGTDPVTMVDRALTAKIKAGTVIVDSNNDGTPDGADAALASITYIIDPTNGNCGAGTYSQAEHDAASVGGATPSFEVGDPKPVAPGVAADVGAGYSDALAKFMAKVDADAAVATAQDALDALLTDERDDIGQAAEIAAAREARDLALAAQTRANDALTAAGAGPINMTGIAAWRARAEVEAAVGEWNTAVRSLTTAGSDSQLGDLAYNEKYVQVDSDQLLALFDDDGNINLANVRQYANADGTNVSSQDPTTGAITGDSAFDAAGNLILPMELWDDDGDSATPEVLRVKTEDTSTFSAVNTRLEDVNAELKLLKEFQEDNQNALLDPVIDQAVWRAEEEQKHYQAQFDAMIADNTDLRTQAQIDAEDDEFSIMSRYGVYTAAKTTRDNAGVKLETAVQAREAATAAVRAAFTSPQDFYQQLVDRRSLLKDRADAEVARLAGLTGDDAPSEAMTEAADMAVTDAQTALEAAQATQESFQDLIADDSPVKDLVLETLKPDSGTGQGDDGGVLVDTIDNAFDAAAAAQAAAENAETASTTAGNAVAALTATDDPTTEDVDETGAVTKNANDIADINASLSGLTGDDGQVGQNTANIAQNMSDITDLDGRVTANEEEIGMDENGMSRIDHNATAISTNADNISTNADNIATNASSISTNAGNIATNADNITTNADSIVANAGNIMTNATNITTNATDIAANDVDIATNASDIMTNAGNIAMNNTYIMENRGNIMTNASDIMAVRGMASENAADIATNAGNIAGNAMNINRNAESIQMLRAGVAASMALAGMPEIGDRGVSVGAGSYDGETALAVGIHFSGENSRFKLGITSADGETGASVGAGWSF